MHERSHTPIGLRVTTLAVVAVLGTAALFTLNLSPGSEASEALVDGLARRMAPAVVPGPQPSGDSRLVPIQAPPRVQPASGDDSDAWIRHLRSVAPEAVERLEASWLVGDEISPALYRRQLDELALERQIVSQWRRPAPGPLTAWDAEGLTFATEAGSETWTLTHSPFRGRGETLGAMGIDLAAPAILSTSNRTIRAIDGRSGSDVWDVRLPTPIERLTVGQGIVLAKTAGMRVWVIVALSGRILGRIPLSDADAVARPVTDGVVVVENRQVHFISLKRLQGMHNRRQQRLIEMGRDGGFDEHDLMLALVHTTDAAESAHLLADVAAFPGHRMTALLHETGAARLNGAAQLSAADVQLVVRCAEALKLRNSTDLTEGVRVRLLEELRFVDPATGTMSQAGSRQAIPVSEAKRRTIHALAMILASFHEPRDESHFLALLQWPSAIVGQMPFQEPAVAYISGMPTQFASGVLNEMIVHFGAQRQMAPFDRRELPDRLHDLEADRLALAETPWADGVAADIDGFRGFLADYEDATRTLQELRRRIADAYGNPTARAQLALAFDTQQNAVRRLEETVPIFCTAMWLLAKTRVAVATDPLATAEWRKGNVARLDHLSAAIRAIDPGAVSIADAKKNLDVASTARRNVEVEKVRRALGATGSR